MPFFFNFRYNKPIFLFIALYFSLLIGFFFGEDSTGGAFSDYKNQKLISIAFANDFFKTFINFDNFNTRHSPALIIYLSLFEKFNISDTIIRILHLNIAPLCCFAFYKCLKLKYEKINNELLLIFSLILLLSPTIRSLAIWPDSRVYGLFFFLISVYFFIKFEKNKKFCNAIYNIIFLSISSYLSPNFSIFSAYFFLNYFLHYKFSMNLAKIVILNMALALPAFYYLFVLDVFFLKVTAISNVETIQRINPFNKIILISSIFFFYFLPFLFFFKKENFFKDVFNIQNIFITTIILLVSIIYFSYETRYTGGGFFFHLSQKIFSNNNLLFFVTFFSILFLIFISKKDYKNLILIFIIFLGNPQLSIYNKYYDPLVLILLLLLFNLNIDTNRIFKLKNTSIFYIFYFSFLLISLFK